MQSHAVVLDAGCRVRYFLTRENHREWWTEASWQRPPRLDQWSSTRQRDSRRNARLLSFNAVIRRSNRRLLPSDQEILWLRLPALSGSRHPTRHAPAAGPGVRRIVGIAIL